ncbi:DUF4251 domain-containing protein [Sinomicrobium sp. M5D2P17]
MKHLHYFTSLLLLVMISSCGATKNNTSDSGALTALDSLVKQKQIRIVNNWAYPMATNAMMQVGILLGPMNNAQRINLIGNPNYLEIKGDSVKAELPYFGERQMGGGYNPDGEGIKFDTKISDWEMNYIAKKKLYRIKFKTRKNSESFNVILEMYPNKRTMLMINSTQRNPISYEGTTTSFEKD